MITLIADNKEIPVEWVYFSDGALTCKVDELPFTEWDYVYFNVDPVTPVKQILEEIKLLWDALGHLQVKANSCNLHLPYLPYARADRVFEVGNPNPLGCFFDDLDSFYFDNVKCYDIHNLEAVYEILSRMNYDFNLEHVSQVSCFQYTCKRYNGYAQKWDYVIAPDKGAKDKAKSIADMLGVPVVQASKERDISTGRIIKTELDTTLPVGSRVIICDDILDAGGTFIPLAEALRSQGCTVDLYVTHLIAAKGLDIFKGLFDNIYCYQTVAKYVNKQDVMNFNLGK